MSQGTFAAALCSLISEHEPDASGRHVVRQRLENPGTGRGYYADTYQGGSVCGGGLAGRQLRRERGNYSQLRGSRAEL